MAYIVLQSKNEELCDIVFSKLIRIIKSNTNLEAFKEIKIMSGFEFSLCGSINKNFYICLLNGCFFYYYKAIWKKIKKLNLFSKKLRLNILSYLSL